MKLGKAKYTTEKKEIFKIKDGDNVFRILPPMGNLADAGVYSRYYKVVWGYKDTKGNNRPFVSPRVQNFRTKMIEVECAATLRVERLKKELDESIKTAKEFAKNKQPLPEPLKAKLEELKELVGAKGRFNIDSKHHMNAMTQDGKIGLLKLAGRGFQALKAKFKQLEASNIDATGVNGGRFMVINRQGTGLDTTYSVEELKQQVKTQEYGLVDKSLPHDLDDAIISRLSNEAYELDSLYPTPTGEEVELIVSAFERSEEEGRQVLEDILGTKDSSSDDSGDDGEDDAVAETKVSKRAEPVKEAPKTSITEQKAAVAAVEEVEETVKVNEETGEIMDEVPQSMAATKNTAAQSDADFLAGLGVKLG